MQNLIYRKIHSGKVSDRDDLVLRLRSRIKPNWYQIHPLVAAPAHFPLTQLDMADDEGKLAISFSRSFHLHFMTYYSFHFFFLYY